MKFFDLFGKSFSELWEKHKIFLLIFGLLILVYKCRNIIIDLLVANSKELVKETAKESDRLKDEQDSANQKANDLIKESTDLDKNKETVDKDWHKK